MESGTASLNDTYSVSSWITVPLQQNYSTPPLIFAMPTQVGGDPVTIRVRNITTSNFEMLQVEPNGSDGPHAAMNINYIAVDPGVHFLPDGTKLIAGKYGTQTEQGNIPGLTTGWDDISFANPFSSTPIVLGSIQTANNEIGNIATDPSEPFLAVTIQSVVSNGFQVALERAEVAPGGVYISETVAYLAIESAKQGTFKDVSNVEIQYETILTDKKIKGWSDGAYDVTYINTYVDPPNVVGAQQTRYGNNGGWLRERNAKTNTVVRLAIDEDQYNDSERYHIAEIGGLLIFEKNFAFDSSTYAPVAEYRMDECFWLGNPNKSVKDHGSNSLDGTPYNGVAIDMTESVIGFS